MWDSRHPPGTPREIWSAKVDSSSSDEEVESVREKEVAKAIETAAPTDIFQCITHCTSTRFSIITFSWC